MPHKAVIKLPTSQIGKCGELLVQYQLLLNGIESAHLTTDSGIDLVAYSANSNTAITIQVKANLKPKPSGGKGKLALDWWITEESPADFLAIADLATNRVWILTLQEVAELAQQKSNGRYHVCMSTDPTSKPRKTGRLSFDFDYQKYLLQNRVHCLFNL